MIKFLIFISSFLFIYVISIFIFILFLPGMAWGLFQSEDNSKAKTENIPTIYLDAVKTAGGMCKVITVNIVAAQIEVESNWNPNAKSDAGAEGIAQFMPSTYQSWGTPGTTPFDANDAILALGKYDCYLANVFKDWQTPLEDALAAYNSGINAVKNAHGVPGSVRDYVDKIINIARSNYSIGSGSGQAAVNAAMEDLGTMYSFGGNCSNPHDGNPNDECDCSSLVQVAWGKAGVHLPRTSEEQIKEGTVVSNISDLQIGDLVFSNWDGGSSASHVVMYIGNGQVIEAPRPGKVVRIATLSSQLSHLVGMKHVG